MLKLAVFDLDGTLKQAPDPYVYLHERLGTLEAAEVFTARGLSGEIPYDEWLRLDTGLWTGTPRSVLVRHLHENPYLPGARETVAALKAAGVIVAIISSGLLLHAQMVAEELGIGPVIGNELFFDGDEDDPVVNGQVRTHCPYGAKRPILEQMQAQPGGNAGGDTCRGRYTQRSWPVRTRRGQGGSQPEPPSGGRRRRYCAGRWGSEAAARPAAWSRTASLVTGGGGGEQDWRNGRIGGYRAISHSSSDPSIPPILLSPSAFYISGTFR